MGTMNRGISPVARACLLVTIALAACSGPNQTTAPAATAGDGAAAPSVAASAGSTQAPGASPGATTAAPATVPPATPDATAAIPPAFQAAGDTLLAMTATGAGTAVKTGKATAAVYCAAGQAPTGATWHIHPLSVAPAGVPKALTPGIYVDTAGAPPTGTCAVGFALPGKASKNATIVKLADDGSVAQVMATSRVETGTRTLLTAYVDGFSAYTTADEDAKARDKAFTDRAKARGKQVDWTIKVIGTETQHVEGWTFTYDLDLFASGGDVAMGGVYRGHVQMDLKGTYKGPVSIIKSAGKITATARDAKLSFYMMDEPLANLLTGEPVGDPIVGTVGVMNLKGFGSLNITASGPNVSGHVDRDANGNSPVVFEIRVDGEDVELEIKNVGIFGGKILRTTQ